MRTNILLTTILLLTVTCSTAFAQQPKIGCVDKSIRLQGEQMKHDFKAQGMEVYKDAMLGMDAKEPYPIAVQLNAQQQYQFIFVGNGNATKLFFELYDGADTKLEERVVENNGGNNFIIYSFTPQKTDLYLVVLSQKVKGKGQVCGSFSVMKKEGSK